MFGFLLISKDRRRNDGKAPLEEKIRVVGVGRSPRPSASGGLHSHLI
jgi:hypothetical protein